MDEMETAKKVVESGAKVFNIDPDIIIIFIVTVLGAIASYFSKIYNKSRDFSFIDFIAVVIVGIFIGFFSFFVAELFDFSKAYTAVLASILSTISMSIITKINQHEGDILKAIIRFILRK